MIDWFRGSIPFLHTPISGGELISVTPEGEQEWVVVRAVKTRGSHESTLQIRSRGSDGKGRATELWIDGNISKFLQGHNLFGSRNLTDLVYKAFTKLTRPGSILEFDIFSAASAEQAILAGEYEVKSLDINQIYQLDNDRSVESWLYACEMQAQKRAGRTTSKRGTVYLGQNSRRWGLKFYNKFQEMLKNQADTHPHYERLLAFAKGTLRIELRLLSLELKDLKLTKGKHFTTDKINALFDEYLGKMTMTKNATLIDDQLLNLPRPVQATYQIWRSGVSCRQLLTKATFFRHRKQLLEHSIDINFPPSSPDRNNVVPLVRVVEAIPIDNPSWAYDLNLIA